MECSVCAQQGKPAKSYYVTGRYMNSRFLSYCDDCAVLVTQILPNQAFTEPAIELREREF